MKKHGLSNRGLCRSIGVAPATVESWRSNGVNRMTRTVSALLAFLETQLKRAELGVPEHLVGYDPDTGTRYVVKLTPPGLIMSARKLVWLDPISRFAPQVIEAAVAEARLLLLSGG